jgi:hypothetical protein
MYPIQIKALKETVKSLSLFPSDYENHYVAWNIDSQTIRRVKSIKRRKDELNEYVAYFDNGEYVALNNCEIFEFVIVKRFEE